jgi:hypothetical protein
LNRSPSNFGSCPVPEAPLDREARSRDLRRALEVEDPQLRTQVPVRLRGKVEGRGLSHPPDLGVGRLVRAHRDLGIGHVGDDEEEAPEALLDLAAPCVPFLDPRRDAFHLRLEIRCVFLRLPAPGDLLAHLPLLVTELLDLRDERPPLPVEGPGVGPGEPGPGLNLLEALPPRLEHGQDPVAILDDELEVEHGGAEHSTRPGAIVSLW